MPKLGVSEAVEVPEEAVSEAPQQPGKRDIDKAAEKIRDRSILPKIPGSRIDSRQWAEWARLLTSEMWSRLALYVYRTFPVIIRQLSDPRNDNNIGIATEVVDIEAWIKEFCGGGKYRVDVTDAGKKICEIRLNIPVHECEPKLEYKELDIYSKENQAYIQALKYRGILGEDGKPRPGGGNVQGVPAPAAISAQDIVGMYNQMLATVTKMGEREREELKQRLQEKSANDGGIGSQIGVILLEKMKQDNPANMMGAFAQMKDLFVKQGGGGIELVLPIFTTMMQQQSQAAERALQTQQQHSKEMMELVKEIKGGGRGGEDDLGSIDKILAVVEKVDAIRGGGGSKSGWETGLEYAKELGLPILQSITQLYSIAKGGGGQQVQQPGQPTRPAAPTGKQITASEIARQQAAEAAREKPAMYRGEPTTAQPVVNGVVEPEVVPPGPPTELMQMLAAGGNYFVSYMQTDRPGYELAEDLIRLQTKAAHVQIARFGVEGIIEGIRNFPELAQALAIYGEEGVKQFVDEFVNYETYAVADDEDVPAIEVGKKGKGGKK